MDKIKLILVPIAGNAADEDALRLAHVLAKPRKARVVALYIIEVERTLPLTAEVPDQVATGELALAQAETIGESLGYKVDTELLQSRAAGPAVVDEATKRRADLIVMGVPYHTRLNGFYLGSTITYVLQHALCQVLVARQAQAAPEPGSETPSP